MSLVTFLLGLAALAGGLSTLVLAIKLKQRPLVPPSQGGHSTLEAQVLTTVATEPSSPDPLDNTPWMNLVEKCVDLIDELDRLLESLDPPRQEMAEHVISRLQEVLERSGVNVISGDTQFDRSRHESATRKSGLSPGTPITATLSPGFAVGRRVLRRARVQLADKEFTDNARQLP